MSQKKISNNIASALSIKGYNVTGSQCLSKFHGMKRTYKSIKDHNVKSGNNPRSWPYMEVMESLLDERPFMLPLAIACSSYISSNRSTSNNTSSTSSKENTSKIAASIIQSRELAEKNREQRHKEKMEFRKEMLDIMKKMLDK
ncbi:uncharacterized protein LOC105422113 [Pogonomyrmex barbatus]|uniref:Uncharacterized protein LOC105422113 n=1 Tax=Pogonomyrmex barbatus TaxID=144034 RepID=A0A8N1S4D6_9HYME|nr:uncharacterized protein LOC105422113 [Pogonomyrmex barbatus]